MRTLHSLSLSLPLGCRKRNKQTTCGCSVYIFQPSAPTDAARDITLDVQMTIYGKYKIVRISEKLMLYACCQNIIGKVFLPTDFSVLLGVISKSIDNANESNIIL